MSTERGKPKSGGADTGHKPSTTAKGKHSDGREWVKVRQGTLGCRGGAKGVTSVWAERR